MKSATREFLIDSYVYRSINGGGYLRVRPRVFCKDGFSISIQASAMHHCDPREDLEDGSYTTVELGFPSERDDLIMQYIEDVNTDPTGTVYDGVPIKIVDKLLKKHGGIADD